MLSMCRPLSQSHSRGGGKRRKKGRRGHRRERKRRKGKARGGKILIVLDAIGLF